MHRNRNQLREGFCLTGEHIPDLLRQAKVVLSARQYKQLRREVNQTVGYAEQKGLIFASIQSKIKNRGEIRQDE